MVQFFNDSIFWVEVEKIKPNPYQPRKEFDDAKLNDLSDSIRQYGILQPLVVTRKEITTEDGGLAVEYELISGERRLRASKLAGLSQVPVLIKASEDNDLVKLELAIIENLQREDLNVVDRARSFQKLADEFGLKHAQIAQKVGKSREYVSNSLRVLALQPSILDALSAGKISEGHTRPLLMLADRPEEQDTLFKEIIYKRLTVREAEAISRRVAYDKVRKKEYIVDPEILEMEEKMAESFGTRVKIERKETGGKVTIDFFSNKDLHEILDVAMGQKKITDPHAVLNRHISDVAAKEKESAPVVAPVPQPVTVSSEVVATITPEAEAEVRPDTIEHVAPFIETAIVNNIMAETPIETPIEELDDRSKEEIAQANNTDDDDIYSVKNFSI
ncbi:MAG: ParB/RepB/Spo0J family partition protein [bacterium]